MLLELFLWSLVTVIGSAAIIIVLWTARFAIELIFNESHKISTLNIIKERKNTVDLLAMAISISVSSCGEVIKFLLDRSNVHLGTLLLGVLLLFIYTSGIVAVLCDVGPHREKINHKVVKFIACCLSATAFIIGICVKYQAVQQIGININ